MGLTSAIKGCNQVTDQQVKNSGVQELQNETAAFRSVNGDYLASIAGDRDRQAKLESRLLDKLSRMEGARFILAEAFGRHGSGALYQRPGRSRICGN
jgi:hypothetical protein